METLIFGLVVALFLGFGIWIGRTKSEKGLPLSLHLLPHAFKLVGLLIAILAFVFVAYSDFENQEIWKQIGRHCINLGLFIYCFSKDKAEDELTNSIRLRSLFTSVISVIIVNILINFLNTLLGGGESQIEAADKLITLMFFVYAFSFASLKRKVFYGR